MQKTIKYTIFRTKWGYFGLAGTDNGLLRTCLPSAKRGKVESQLLRNLQNCRFDKDFFKSAQRQVTAYFEGDCVSFEGIPVVLDGLGLFAKRVLTTCRGIRFGETVAYGRLAKLAGRCGAARAVGGVMARNPLPLIIPCHRVVCANGKVGGFSAIGGVKLKRRLLQLEQQAV